MGVQIEAFQNRDRPQRAHLPRQVSRDVEAVEKVPKQILGRDAEKSDLIECATITDLMLGKGQETPENIILTPHKGFSYRLVSGRIR
jgi:hypothetical protein